MWVPALPPPVPVDRATVTAGQAQRDERADRLAPLLRRSEVRSRALAYIEGLPSAAERKHGGQLAAVQGDATPYGMPHLRHRACGSADAACAALQRYVSDPLGDPQGILRIDETGFRKQGTHSAWVARQDRGPA